MSRRGAGTFDPADAKPEDLAQIPEPWRSCVACRRAVQDTEAACWYPACAAPVECGGSSSCCQDATCPNHERAAR